MLLSAHAFHIDPPKRTCRPRPRGPVPFLGGARGRWIGPGGSDHRWLAGGVRTGPCDDPVDAEVRSQHRLTSGRAREPWSPQTVRRRYVTDGLVGRERQAQPRAWRLRASQTPPCRICRESCRWVKLLMNDSSRVHRTPRRRTGPPPPWRGSGIVAMARRTTSFRATADRRGAIKAMA